MLTYSACVVRREYQMEKEAFSLQRDAKREGRSVQQTGRSLILPHMSSILLIEHKVNEGEPPG